MELRDRATLHRGRVVVACVPTIACHALSKVLATFSQRYPGIDVQVVDDGAQALIRRVSDRTADIGIGPFPERADDLQFTSIAHDRFVAVFPQQHPLAGASKVRLKDLLGFPLLTLVSGTNVRAVLERAFEQQGLAFRPAFEVLNYYTPGWDGGGRFGSYCASIYGAVDVEHGPIVEDIYDYKSCDHAGCRHRSAPRPCAHSGS